jgi:hypothetical protein
MKTLMVLGAVAVVLALSACADNGPKGPPHRSTEATAPAAH